MLLVRFNPGEERRPNPRVLGHALSVPPPPDSPGPPVSLPPIIAGRHTARMAVVFSVLADSPEEAARELARLCELLGLESAGAPTPVIGRDKWMGRARVATPPQDRPRT